MRGFVEGRRVHAVVRLRTSLGRFLKLLANIFQPLLLLSQLLDKTGDLFLIRNVFPIEVTSAPEIMWANAQIIRRVRENYVLRL
jgi:hypothetical protein